MEVKYFFSKSFLTNILKKKLLTGAFFLVKPPNSVDDLFKKSNLKNVFWILDYSILKKFPFFNRRMISYSSGKEKIYFTEKFFKNSIPTNAQALK